jgi:hypothetical protein
MIFDSIIETSVRFGSLLYRSFEQYVINYIVNFGKGFEQVFVMIAIITFLLLSVFLLIRQAKKLPKYYFIEIVDIFGRSIILDDLRVNFSTYDAAESYSQFYSALFGEQYRFRVTGSRLRRNYASNRIKKRNRGINSGVL